MVFPNSNLPANAQPWVRDIQKRLEATETTVKANNINNTARDVQLENNYKRLDATVNQAALAASAAQAAADNAQAALDGLGNLDQSTSTYKINAANLTVGSLSGDRISGGTITGTTVQTDNSPNSRISMSNTDDSLNFFDQNDVQVGKIRVSGSDRAGVLNVEGPATNYSIQLSSSSSDLKGGGNTIRVSEVGVEAFGTLYANNGVSSSGTISAGTLSGSYATVTNSCTAGSFTTTGTVSGSTVSAGTFSGTSNPSIANNTTASFSGNVFINTSGTMFRSTATSSREAKENIRPLAFDAQKFIDVSPVIFDYKDGIVADDSGNNVIGFIAEDFADAGINEVIIPKDIDGPYIGLRYDKLYMYLHKVVQEQNNTIKSLTARIEALEAK